MQLFIQIETPRADRAALRVFRCLRRMTQQELAGLVGVSQPTLSRLERGGLPTDARVAQQIADALEVAMPVLFPELAQDGEANKSS